MNKKISILDRKLLCKEAASKEESSLIFAVLPWETRRSMSHFPVLLQPQDYLHTEKK